MSRNAHTQGIYRGSLDNHVLPGLEKKPVARVVPADATALHYHRRAANVSPSGIRQGDAQGHLRRRAR